ncbi:MAG: TRAP transporter large permease subunit, partial [Mailhella sp.]
MNNLFILLVLTAFTAIVLGIGLPSPAAYIICATILSPALVKMGVPLLQAHLFPLYYALFSHLTPPVGIGLMVACKMADSHYLKSAVEAMKAAFPSFVLPFLFVYSPGVLLLGDSASSNTLQIIASIVFFFAMAVATNRYFAGACRLSDMVLSIASFTCLSAYLLLAQHPIILLLCGAVLLAAGLAINIVLSRSSCISS